MPKINLLQLGVRGVDMKSNPLLLGGKKLCSAVNMRFEEGVIKTRPGFVYVETGITGQFQGMCFYRPQRGISSSTFSNSEESVVIAAGGKLWSGGEEISGLLFRDKGDVHLYQAENYLVAQNTLTDTFWWDGTTLTRSPGTQEVMWEDEQTPVHVNE